MGDLLPTILGGSVAATTEFLAFAPVANEVQAAGTAAGLIVSRCEAVSFFGLVLLLAVPAARWLWNSMRQDFPRIPSLSIGRAAMLVGLWAMLVLVVLTAISTAREFMMPGVGQGSLYRANAQPIDPASPLVNAPTEPSVSKTLAALAIGWLRFASSRAARVQVSWDGLAVGAAALILLLSTVHAVGRLAWRSERGEFGAGRNWRLRSSCTVILGLMLAYIAAQAAIGLARHIGWLLTS